MDWFPIVFIILKIGVFGAGMFFAIKWHHERARKQSKTDTRTSASTIIMIASLFVLLLVGLLLTTFYVSEKLGLNLNFS